jgi:hypothetical protein
LGCIIDNDVKVSQHFFALKLDENDLLLVLAAMKNASVVTDPSNEQVVRNGGPTEIRSAVDALGRKSDSTEVFKAILSTGIELISKPSRLHVPPWQLVSSLLGRVPLRTATWWATPKIPSSDANTRIDCWSADLPKPGDVQIALNGRWQNTPIGLEGGPGKNKNHAKLGVSIQSDQDLVVFGDMNQQGTLSGPNCGRSQNGRGGLFYVVREHGLAASVRALLDGDTAPLAVPADALVRTHYGIEPVE